MSISKLSIRSLEDTKRAFRDKLKQIIDTEFGGETKLLATEAGFAQATLSKIMTGKRAPTAKLVGGIARMLKTTRLGDELIASFAALASAEASFHRAASKRTSKAILYPDQVG